MADSFKGFSNIGVNNVDRFAIIERSKPMVDTSTEKLRTRRASRQKSKLVRTKKILIMKWCTGNRDSDIIYSKT